METKICAKCKRELPIESFKFKKGKPYYMCKECEREYMIEYRKRNRTHINQQHREYMKDYMKNPINRERLKIIGREFQRKKLGIKEENFRGPDQLKKGQTKYNRQQISKMSRYGLTPEQFDRLPDRCEVCGSTVNLCIDHDHVTGNYRGVLCNNCNLALGHLHDDPNIMIKLLNYITSKRSGQII